MLSGKVEGKVFPSPRSPSLSPAVVIAPKKFFPPFCHTFYSWPAAEAARLPQKRDPARQSKLLSAFYENCHKGGVEAKHSADRHSSFGDNEEEEEWEEGLLPGKVSARLFLCGRRKVAL